MANFITGLRILCSLALLFCRTLSPAFYVLYLIAGFTDMVDGTIARKTNTASEFGSRLDTTADFIFVVVCLIELAPVMDIPVWIYVWIAIIAMIKVINVVSGYAVQKKFVAVHTIMNKAAGAVLFILPLTLSMIDLKYSAIVVCLIATFAAIQEGHYIRKGRKNDKGNCFYN